MSQKRLNADEQGSRVIDTPEMTASESVSIERGTLTICQFKQPETYTFETQSGLRNAGDSNLLNLEFQFARLSPEESPRN